MAFLEEKRLFQDGRTRLGRQRVRLESNGVGDSSQLCKLSATLANTEGREAP